MEFEEFPKMARLTRECVITEKIDGTNAQIAIREMAESETLPVDTTSIIACWGNLLIYAGSRTRWITPEADNFGFARWVRDHSEELVTLGPGRHFGEWWGQSIQRGYGLTEKRFSLFNVSRWHAAGAAPYITESVDPRVEPKSSTEAPACCSVVPILYRGLFGPKHDENFIAKLRAEGSIAAPGFMKPEGVVIYHVAAGVAFKKTCEKDEQPKSRIA